MSDPTSRSHGSPVGVPGGGNISAGYNVDHNLTQKILGFESGQSGVEECVDEDNEDLLVQIREE